MSLPHQRWHFQHGPIDLIISAEGDPLAVADAHERAWRRFVPLLDELVAELPLLKRAIRAGDHVNPCSGETAALMWEACRAMVDDESVFITPMAAVAGAVAQTIARVYASAGSSVTKATINNGGDIALVLNGDAVTRIGVVGNTDAVSMRDAQIHVASNAEIVICGHDAVRGIATSGWRGRSFSLGIADSVTTLARTAAMADAAATVIANAVTVDDARIVRRRASELKDGSDLGDILVTTHVPALPAAQVEMAIANGLNRAQSLVQNGRVDAVLIQVQGQWAVLNEAWFSGLPTRGKLRMNPLVSRKTADTAALSLGTLVATRLRAHPFTEVHH